MTTTTPTPATVAPPAFAHRPTTRPLTRACTECGGEMTFRNPWGDRAVVSHRCPVGAVGAVWTLIGPAVAR